MIVLRFILSELTLRLYYGMYLDVLPRYEYT